MITYIGIDPGVSGAYAVLRCKEREIREVTLHKWTDLKKVAMELELLKNYLYGIDTFAALEQVHASPQMGRSSVFTFGKNFGNWEGLLCGLGMPYELVSPQKWKKVVFKTNSTRLGKDSSIDFVNLHPDLLGRVDVGRNHNYADALCLALYAKGFYEQLS